MSTLIAARVFEHSVIGQQGMFPENSGEVHEQSTNRALNPSLEITLVPGRSWSLKHL